MSIGELWRCGCGREILSEYLVETFDNFNAFRSFRLLYLLVANRSFKTSVSVN